MSNNAIYLLPELIGDGGNTLFQSAVQVSTNPIKVPGYRLFTFMRRLNNHGFSTYCVAIQDPSKECFMYPVKFSPDNIPDFESCGFLTTPILQGIIVHISQPTFDVMDKTDKAIAVRSGDWLNEREHYNQLAALHYLGIIPDFSPAIFKQDELFNQWINKLHQAYGTYGDLNQALNMIFKRCCFAINFFCVTFAMPLVRKISFDSTSYYFAILYDDLTSAPEICTMKNILPNTFEIDSPYIILYTALRTAYEGFNTLKFNVQSLDDVDGFTKAARQFQESAKMQEGACDIKTLRKLITQSKMQRYYELPIFKMAGIDIKQIQEPDFPMIPKLDRDEKDPLAELVRNEINNSINAMPDPSSKIEWMNAEIENTFIECDGRCSQLSERVGHIERSISEMSRQLKDVVEESKAAARKVQTASKTLDDVFQAHNKIQGKFEILREKLYAEQRNTRLTLIITIILTIIGAFTLRF